MPLDPQTLLSQIENAMPNLMVGFRDLENNVADAVALYQAAQADEWRELVQNSQAKQQSLGYPFAGLHQNLPSLAKPKPYTVVATDGSTIPPDRHNGTALYHVLNTGRVMLRYGPDSDAHIDSRTQFFAGDVTDEEQESSAPLVIDLKRDLYEVKEALELAREYKADLVLMDGPLTMWNSRTLTDKQSNEYRQSYYNLLGVLRDERIPVIGYISNAHSKSVTNSLRLLLKFRPQAAMFDDELAPKNVKPRAKSKNEASGLSGVQDALFFKQTLNKFHYSETFKTAFSEPKELADHIGGVCFVYWRTETELVRLEFPEWLAHEPEKLADTIGLVHDQHRLGQGYPVALMEAHESAVLRTVDRELLKILLQERGLLQTESEKGRSKRLRGV